MFFKCSIKNSNQKDVIIIPTTISFHTLMDDIMTEYRLNCAILIALNVAATVKPGQRYDVLALLLVEDLECANAVFPVLCRLIHTQKECTTSCHILNWVL